VAPGEPAVRIWNRFPTQCANRRQEGDYFGQTVNVSARIAEYARQGEVLVSQAVADASQEEGLAFGDIGPVELKGVSGTVYPLRAHLA
jgi:class 3 adenylate cyclase